MRRRLSRALPALALGLLLGCGAAQPRGPGETLHVAKCGACHPRPAPERFDRAGWQRVLDEHHERVPLEPSERADLLAWLAGSGRAPSTAVPPPVPRP